MPDLGNLLNSSSLILSSCSNLKAVVNEQSDSVKTLGTDHSWSCNWEQKFLFPIRHKENLNSNGGKVRVLRKCKKSVRNKSLDSYVKAWVAMKIESGVPQLKCFLPFLVKAPRLVNSWFSNCLLND
ncbi:unnamed protein product [Ilex paraguariensis]|uniref:Uncharacterized protein n=1 Tax=Ilex paraguariensis TaxID=185542 RepID=A0ABC8TX41_9AQUA